MIKLLGELGFVVTVSYGPRDPVNGPCWTVHVFSPKGNAFEHPLIVDSFDDAVAVAIRESRQRGWFSEVEPCG